MAFYLCATMSLFAGSYDTTTHIGIPWQVPTQSTNADRCTGDQLQVANVANQGNTYEKSTLMWPRKKTCKDGKDLRVF